MTLSYVIDKVLTSSILILFFYSCFATLVLCIAYLTAEEMRRIIAEKREQRELESRLKGSAIDPVVDELYES